MKFFKSKNERLLVDFPWLWAVRPSWSEHSKIYIQTMDSITCVALLHNAKLASVHTWWVKATRGGTIDDRLGEVKRVTYIPERTVAEMVRDTFSTAYLFQFLVAHTKNDEIKDLPLPYFIFRAPKHMTLNELCMLEE